MKVRPRRGFVVVREMRESSLLWRPDQDPHDVTTHRGRVLAIGAPSLVGEHEVPWGFDVGATVQFHWEETERGRTLPWFDGEDVKFLMQREIDAVIE
jgi:co-chaperonin GroES (HSP10)